MTPVSCFKCRFLRITWDKKRPYACTGMGFKTKKIPSLVVRQSSGEECRMFQPKTGHSKMPSKR